MTTLTPKQREIRNREVRILAAASPLVRRGGLAAISMDAIAKSMNYTRGTIYNHFPNKEDVVLSLAARAVRRRLRLFQFAAGLSGVSRERIAAIGLACEVYADHLSDDFFVEQMIRHDTVWQKSSARRREILLECEQQCVGLVAGVINDAVAAGDFRPPAGREVADVVLGLWSLVYGGLVLEATSPSLRQAGIGDARAAIRRNCNAMLDGLRWRAPYHATRYNALVKRTLPLLIDEVGPIVSGDDLGERPPESNGVESHLTASPR